MPPHKRKIDVPIGFRKSETVFHITDVEPLKKCLILFKAMSMQYSDEWEERDEDIIFNEPLVKAPICPIAASVVLKHVGEYVAPGESWRRMTGEEYPELNKMDLTKLKFVMQAADYFECLSFMKCPGLVIGKKLENHSSAFIGNYLDLLPKPKEDKATKNDEKNCIEMEPTSFKGWLEPAI